MTKSGILAALITILTFSYSSAANQYQTKYNPWTHQQDYVISTTDLEVGDLTATGTISGVTTESDPLSVLSSGTRTGATSQAQAFTNGIIVGNDMNISGNRHHFHISIVNPNAVITASTIIPIFSATDAALTVTKIQVTTSSASYEVAGDLKYADARIGLANAVVINDFDTTSGVRTDTSITSGAVASGKFVYLSFDSVPNASMTDCVIDIYFDYD